MAVPTNRGNWGKVLDRVLTEVFHNNLILTLQMYTKIFAVKSSAKASEKHLTGVGLEDWRQSAEGQAASFTTNIQGFTKNYVHNVWKSGFSITRELMDDDLYDVAASDARTLGETAIRTIDKQSAKVINNATNTTYFTGADGLALVSASHTREDAGTALSNSNTGVFNETNVETMMVRFMERLDGRGELVDLNPDTLLVPPQLEKEARILMKSQGRTATANNDINPYNGALDILPWKRIGTTGGGSDTQWAVLDSKFNKSGRGLNIFMRVNPEINSEVELETGVKKYVGYMRFSLGFTDWRGFEFSTGTV